MSKARTQPEIDEMIEKLKVEKLTLPEVNFFGDNNWAIYDLQIDILEGNISDEDELWDKAKEDGIDDSVVSMGLDAFEWLEGNRDTLVDE